MGGCEKFFNNEESIEIYTKAFGTFDRPTGMQPQTFRVEEIKSPVQNL
jgi:hypothetical protein